jgi:L-rhamnonate dehydratase
MGVLRRDFLTGAAAVAAGALTLPSLGWAQEKSKLKITGVRLVRVAPKNPPPAYTPTAGSWSTQGVEVSAPPNIYPEFRATRSLFAARNVPSFTVEITTDKGIVGYGNGGAGGGAIVMGHLAPLMIGRDPFDIERNWDINWRVTESYGQAGVTMNAISGFDNALWDIIGKALGEPVWRLLGGDAKARIPAYCTGNDTEQHVKFGYRRVKLAMPAGPPRGEEGKRANLELVARARKMVGPDGDVMCDCWMSWDEQYTIEMCKLMEPYRVKWVEEVLPPYDFEGFGRLRRKITSTNIATGEHVYGRYGFAKLLKADGASIWQPDVAWCGGMSELRKIGALAEAFDIDVIPHDGGRNGATHWSISHVNAPWAELFMPPPGGPKQVYDMFEEQYEITRGPEGLYMHPPRIPGWGWGEVVATPV